MTDPAVMSMSVPSAVVPAPTPMRMRDADVAEKRIKRGTSPLDAIGNAALVDAAPVVILLPVARTVRKSKFRCMVFPLKNSPEGLFNVR